MNRPGLISLTFDDALPEHLDCAVPLLDARGLAGTFYAPLSAPALLGRREEWRAAVERGHELGNHTIFHPAEARKEWVTEGIAIERYSLDRMRQELSVANQLLASIDGRQERSFAYPCSNPWVGERGWPRRLLAATHLDRTRLAGWIDRYGLDAGAGRRSYEPLVRQQFPAARGGGLTWAALPPPFAEFQRWLLPSVAIENNPLEQITDYVSRALQRETWVILQFHGVGGGHHMDCDVDVFRGLLDWIVAKGFAPRVATVLEGAARSGVGSV